MNIVENALGTLANISDHCDEYHDLIITNSILQKLDRILQQALFLIG